MSYDKLFGMYRGIVTYNSNYVDGTAKESASTTEAKTDEELKGRCKVFVYGVYPEIFLGEPAKLPWAEPAYPIFGGNADGVGVNSVPKEGSHVWVFFEQGDYNKPVYSFGCQGGDGWVADHVKQHVIKTDSVEITIDEDYENGWKSSTLTINVDSSEGEAVNIDITGNVNLTISGDVAETINGDVTRDITGNVAETIEGDVTRDITGNVVETITGDVAETITGTYDATADGIMTLKGNEVQINP